RVLQTDLNCSEWTKAIAGAAHPPIGGCQQDTHLSAGEGRFGADSVIRRCRLNVRVAEKRTRLGVLMSTLLKRNQRPFLCDLGLSCTDCQEQALRRGSVGADSLLKLPSRPEPSGGSRVLQHCAKGSLLAPLADRSPIHSHPPIDGSANDKQSRFSSPAAICLATLTFGNARSNQCHAPRTATRRR